MGGSQSQGSYTSKYQENLQSLQCLDQIIFGLNEDNIKTSVETSLKYFSEEISYSFNLIICRIIYSYFKSKGFYKSSFEYLKELENKEKEINNNLNNKITEFFSKFLLTISTQESNFLLAKLIENGIIEPTLLTNKISPYFIHYISKEEINKFENDQFGKYLLENIEILQENDWELHKKYISEGINQNEISKIIRNDEFEKLQEIISQPNFDINQTIEPSLYERCSYINTKNVSLIDYAAFFSAVKCFKYLLLNNCELEHTGKYAIAGGNLEIIHLCELNHTSFEDSYEAAIEFHRNDIFIYIYENKIIEINDIDDIITKCIIYDNYEILSFLLEKEEIDINDNIIKTSIETGNLFIVQYLLEKNPISIDFFGNFFHFW